jgi:hypothetical protein
VVLISGEPGIGKSRIAQTIVDRLGGEPHTRLDLVGSTSIAAKFDAGESLHPQDRYHRQRRAGSSPRSFGKIMSLCIGAKGTVIGPHQQASEAAMVIDDHRARAAIPRIAPRL